MSNHGLDTNSHVYFYEQEFYVLSNFSSFRLYWKRKDFDTSEHAYQWEKFEGSPLNTKALTAQSKILIARSAHEAFKIADEYTEHRREDWLDVRVPIMKRILYIKAVQHEYVRKKLFETENRILVENSWRDNFWGIGPSGNGDNMLGKLWMQIREELLWDLSL